MRGNDEKVVEIEIERLHDFKNHPFKVQADSQMKELQDSISKYGILNPLIVRPRPEGFYEVISGHRRKYAAMELKYTKVPVIIRYMLDEEAMENTLATPNLSQAIRIKKMQEEENISVDSVEAIITEVKQKEITRVVFKNEQLYRYFPSYYTAEQMRREILTLLKINMESYLGGDVMDQYYKKWSKVLVAPAVILFICIVAIPFIIGVVYSFTSWRGTYFAGGSLTESFVGLDNYIKTFTNEKFRDSFFYTCIFTVLSVVTVNVCAMLLALLVTNIMKGSGIFRTIIFMPNMLGGLALGFIWQFIFQVVFTDILFGKEGFLHIEALRYMTQDPVKALFALLLMTTWQNAGYMMIIYVGGLNAVSTELYEAASLDGASAFQRFRKITLPLLMPSITIVLFLTLSNSFKLLDQNVALTDGEFGTRMLALQILRTLKDTNPPDYGGAQAQAVIFFIVMAIISFIQVSVTRKKEVEM